MAWIYFRELVGSQSPLDPGLEQLPIVKSSATLRASYCRECNQVTLTMLQSSTMCEISVNGCSQKSTLSMADSRARTLAALAAESAWRRVTEADSSSKLCVSPKKSDRLLYSLKMYLRSEQEDLVASSVNYPYFGMILGGRFYQPRNLGPRTSEDAGSYLLPTPTASEAGTNMGGGAGRTGKIRPSSSTMAKKNLWPTPQAKDWKGSYASPESLQKAIFYHKAKGVNKQVGLADSVMMSGATGGQLSPTWVEWLMGYPSGWTVLSVSVTQWYQYKPAKRLKG